MSDFKTEYDGVYFDGRTPVRNEVKVTVTSQGLKLLDKKHSGTTFWSYLHISQTNDVHADGRVKFENSSSTEHSALIVEDTSIIDAIKNIAPDYGGGFHRSYSRSGWARLLFYSFAGAVVAGFIIYRWLIPAFVDVVSEMVPVSWEKSVGNRYRVLYSQPFEECNDAKINESVEMIMSRLVSSLDKSPYDYHVTILHEKMINAFALPGGNILLLDGLIKSTERPEELAGVLAHEIEHVEQRHSTKKILREASFGLLVSAISGNSQGFDRVLQTAKQFGALGYSRDAEQSADTEGMKLLIKSGIDPSGMIDFFGTMKEENGDMDGVLHYFSTHPSTGDRIARLKNMIKGKKFKTIVLPDENNWEEIRDRCMATEQK